MEIFDAIDRAARDFPEKIAHLSGGRTLTYQALKQHSGALAAHFAECLPGDKSPVAVIGHKEPEMLVGFLAAVKSGRPYVPIDVSIDSGAPCRTDRSKFRGGGYPHSAANFGPFPAAVDWEAGPTRSR